MDFEAVCRTCLGTNSLNPIFKIIEHHARFTAAMISTTGLKVELNDGLPQNICIDCMAHINASLKFRVRCKDAETKLLLFMTQDTNNPSVPDEKDVKEIERKAEDIDFKMIHDLFENKTDYFDDNKLEEDLESKDKDNIIHNVKSENVIILENKILDIKKLKCNVFKHEISEKNNLEDDKKPFLTEIDCNINKSTLLKEIKIEGEIDDLNKKEKQKVKCTICNKSLSTRSVDNHMSKRHPGADERKVKCELCDTYILKMKLNRHLRMMHGKNYSICTYCKLEFRTKECLIEHAALCADRKRKRNPRDTGKELSECDVCHKKMQKASLKMHQKIKHAGLGPVCDDVCLQHCGRKFGNKFRLNEHLRSKHGYEKYKCAECHFESASTVAMRNHERRHRGEKPYVCELCGARFHAAYLLPQHRQSHRTEKTLKCDLCPASFKANNSLHMHKAACHSNATYKCTLCERAYSCRNYAVKHMRAVHSYTGPVPNFDMNPAS